MRFLSLIAFVLLALARPAPAQDFAAGQRAYDRQDYAEALRQWQPLAESGNAQAQAGLGMLYASGQGVAKNPVEATRWFRKAAEQGDARAQHLLGGAYGSAFGTPRNLPEALKWIRKAADQGYPDAQNDLGVAAMSGSGGPRNPGEAVAWFRKAADQGHAQAQNNLGLAYADGIRARHSRATRNAAKRSTRTGWPRRRAVRLRRPEAERTANQGDCGSLPQEPQRG